MDDVQAPLVSPFLDFYNPRHGTAFRAAEFKTYSLPEALGISLEDSIAEMRLFYRSGLLDKIPPYPEAQAALRILKAEGDSLYTVTSRFGEAIPVTKRWEAQNNPGIFTDIYFSANGHVGIGTLSKKIICQKLSMDAIIEDDQRYATECAEAGILAFLLERPWNEGYAGHENVFHVKDWTPIIDGLQRMRRGERPTRA